MKHGKGLYVAGEHRSRTERAHRKAGLGELWERALKHVGPPPTESDALESLQAMAACTSFIDLRDL